MDFQSKTDKELVEDGDIGARGLAAQLEMMRRLKDAIERADESTTRFNKITLVFSFAVIFLTVVQIVIALSSLFGNSWKFSLAATTVILATFVVCTLVTKALSTKKK